MVLPESPDPWDFAIAADVHLPNAAARIYVNRQRSRAIVEPNAAIEAGGLPNTAYRSAYADHVDLFEAALRQTNAGDFLLNDRPALLQRRVAFLTGRNISRQAT